METKKTTKEKGYIEAVGRRKTSTARVRLTQSDKGHFVVNDKDMKVYFPTLELSKIAGEPLAKSEEKFDVSAKVNGGGIHSQAEAVRHAIARILIKIDEELRPKLKKLGYLKRDPRMKERRKFGLKKARKSPQWSKR